MSGRAPEDTALAALAHTEQIEGEAKRSLDLGKIASRHSHHDAEKATGSELGHDEVSELPKTPHLAPSDPNYREYDDAPTEEEKRTLRREGARLDYRSLLLAVIELCERFSYYGCTIVYTNFIQQPMPEGSTTGSSSRQAGALGKGQQTAFAVTTFNNFWVYTMPIFGGYMADTYWGKFNTVCIATAVALFGHVILTISAIPSVLKHPDGSLACFIVAIIIIGIGTGTFKTTISPLVAEQSKNTRLQVKTKKNGERVILDPSLTTARLYMWFYLFINVGALVGQISMVYAEQRVGFWLAFFLPTAVFLLCPFILFFARNRYVRTPPEGSVLESAWKLWRYAAKGKWSLNPMTVMKNMNVPSFWEDAKPSAIAARGETKPSWMHWDDAWVDEVKRGLKACRVFIFYPFYWLSYNQITNNLIAQAAVLDTGGLPNDLINNLDPLALIIFIPILDIFVYPAMRKAGFRLAPLQRIFWGFMLGSAGMIWSAVVQHYIYKTSPCGKEAASCQDEDKNPLTSDISVWVQTGAYVLVALSEICALITALEYAYLKAPKNMRSLVMGCFWITQSFSAALGEAFTSASRDPNLIWGYGSTAVIAFVAGILFWICFRHLDKEDQSLNEIAEAKFIAEEQDLEKK